MSLPQPLRSHWYATLRLGRECRSTAWGVVAADPRFPRVHEANLASVLESAPGLTAEDIRRDLHPAVRASGAPEEYIEFMDADAPSPAIEHLRATTEDHDRDVAMVLEEPPGSIRPSGARAGEVPQPDERYWTAFRQVPLAYGGDPPEEVLDQMLDRVRRVLVPVGLRLFEGRLDGELAGVATVLTLEGVAYIDNVVTFSRFRNQGVATAMIRSAVAAGHEAGARTVFLLAEEDGAPQRLYERLGFRVRCRCTGFTSPLEGVALPDRSGPG